MTRVPLKPFVSLKRLRAGFLLLGTLLLAGLLALSLVIQSRLNEARRAREEMVADRVFDELERELSAFLDGESERTRYRTLSDTDPSTWAPFLAGYFIRTGQGTDIVAADNAAQENRRRVLWAIDQSLPLINAKNGDDPEQKEKESDDVVETEETHKRQQPPRPSSRFRTAKRSSPNRAQAAKKIVSPLEQEAVKETKNVPSQIQAKEASDSKILERLNRAPTQRKSRAKTKHKEKEKAASSQDPFGDYTESY